MTAMDASEVRAKLRQLLRVARFQGLSLDDLEDEIDKLFRGEVDDQPPAQPDQIPEPA